jgi:hypothetical protein
LLLALRSLWNRLTGKVIEATSFISGSFRGNYSTRTSSFSAASDVFREIQPGIDSTADSWESHLREKHLGGF